MDHLAADFRKCEQCGTSFVPRHEHARFCSAPCREAWNREHAGDLAAGASALVWGVGHRDDRRHATAVAGRGSRPAACVHRDRRGGVEGHHRRRHVAPPSPVRLRQRDDTPGSSTAGSWSREPWPGCVSSAIASPTKATLASSSSPAPPARPLVKGGSPPGPGGPRRNRPWRRFLRGRRTWEKARHRGYQEQLAGRAIGETLSQATAFLKLAAANAQAITDASIQAGH